jgi:H+/Cl- antiporter ClcA
MSATWSAAHACPRPDCSLARHSRAASRADQAVEGVGYSTIQAILTGGLEMPALLLLLFAAKLCATSVSLGSGASGGIFSPSLFMGATIGGAFGVAVNAIMPDGRISAQPPAP